MKTLRDFLNDKEDLTEAKNYLVPNNFEQKISSALKNALGKDVEKKLRKYFNDNNLKIEDVKLSDGAANRFVRVVFVFSGAKNIKLNGVPKSKMEYRFLKNGDRLEFMEVYDTREIKTDF